MVYSLDSWIDQQLSDTCAVTLGSPGAFHVFDKVVPKSHRDDETVAAKSLVHKDGTREDFLCMP